MAEIKVLDKHVAELIAAGEVVERPSSVIKELVENSIDAGATVITVEIRRGGVSFMRVTDNGCGIERDYASTAFLRHATSKIVTQEDLDSIGTLGFRGEALASISAVSHMELLTKTPESEIGLRLVCDGGEITDLSDAGCPAGTTMIVRDLFYNTPARMKFLKKDVTEGNSVAGILDKIALSHPEISFRLVRDGKEVLHTPGDNKLRSAVYAVFGKDFAGSLLPVESKLNQVEVSGFITAPAAARPNRTMQNFFINGRFIRSRTACAALEEAFKGSVMVGKFPGCVLHLQMNFASVDVNVHPAKLEVRFTNERPIFDAVYNAVKSALTAGDKPKVLPVDRQLISSFPRPEKQEQTVLPEARERALPVERKNPLIENLRKTAFYEPNEAGAVSAQTAIERLLDVEPEPVLPPEPRKGGQGPARREEAPATEPAVEEPAAPVVADAPVSEPEEERPVEEKPPEPPRPSARLIGEAFGTYILLQYGPDQLMLIDKHAAHERLLYERLRRQDLGKEAQRLLAPIPLTLEKADYDTVLQNLSLFSESGFEIDDFGGGTVLVRSAPLILDGEDAASAVAEAAHYLMEHKNSITTEYMDWLYHNIACRAAVKAGDRSDSRELIALAEELEQNPEIRYCPHGRPISMILRKKDIEKGFGRI